MINPYTLSALTTYANPPAALPPKCLQRRSVLCLMALLIYASGVYWGILVCNHFAVLTIEQTAETSQQQHATLHKTIPQQPQSSWTAQDFVRDHTVPKTRKRQRRRLDSSTSTTEVCTKHMCSVAQLNQTVGTPILLMGMMKAGTTSLFGYFRCGMRKMDDRYLSHYDCKPNLKDREASIRMSCGRRMKMNLTVRNETSHFYAFDGMDQFILYAELDGYEKSKGLILPQWSYLEEMYKAWPRATWILNLRDPQAWLKSVTQWRDLRQRLVDNDYPPVLPAGKGDSDDELLAFYAAQAQRVRQFVMEHPSLDFIEVAIDDDPDTVGKELEDFFGITKSCWGNRNANNGTGTWEMLPQ